jgi:hypothetical protein
MQLGNRTSMLVGLVLTIAVPANALMLCAPKKGQGALRVRDTCKKKEVVIDPASIGLEGLQGPAGMDGATGIQGDPGPVGVSGYEVVTSMQQTIFVENSGGMPGLSELVTLPCPDGKHALAGGADLSATDKGVLRDVWPVLSRPTADGSGWEVRLFNGGTSFDFNAELVVRVACATVAP